MYGTESTPISYQVMTNREYDARHNIMNQKTETYTSKGGTKTEVQEIRSDNYSTSGVARNQTIATYGQDADGNWTRVIEVREVDNVNIDASGNVLESNTTIYKTGTVNADGTITGVDAVEKDHAITSYDKFGNVTLQTTDKTYYMKNAAGEYAWQLMDKQITHNQTFDIHGSSNETHIENFWNQTPLEPGADWKASDTQIIKYIGYDVFGNPAEQTIDRYDGTKVTYVNLLSQIGGGNATGNLIDHKWIKNTYGDPVAQRKGVATETITKRYDTIVSDHASVAVDLTNLIEETTTWTDMTKFETLGLVGLDKEIGVGEDAIDDRGNAIWQYSVTSKVDRSSVLPTGWVKLEEGKRLVHNLSYDDRGDAASQETTSWQVDRKKDASGNYIMVGGVYGTESTPISYQVMTNREYDARHNIMNQKTETYTSKGGTKTEVQEIRSDNYSTSGVARNQTIATYGQDADGNWTRVIEVREVDNVNIDASGNVLESNTTIYKTGTVNADGTITGVDAVEKDHAITSYDKFGNVTLQTTDKTYYMKNAAGENAWQLMDKQITHNQTFDIHGRSNETHIENFWNQTPLEPGADWKASDTQIIKYIGYDVFGNPAEQTIDRYDGTK